MPETKRLTLEEMDVIFGSDGTAQADFERMAEINREIGLDTLLAGAGGHTSGSGDGRLTPEEKREISETQDEKQL